MKRLVLALATLTALFIWGASAMAHGQHHHAAHSPAIAHATAQPYAHEDSLAGANTDRDEGPRNHNHASGLSMAQGQMQTCLHAEHARDGNGKPCHQRTDCCCVAGLSALVETVDTMQRPSDLALAFAPSASSLRQFVTDPPDPPPRG